MIPNAGIQLQRVDMHQVARTERQEAACLVRRPQLAPRRVVEVLRALLRRASAERHRQRAVVQVILYLLDAPVQVNRHIAIRVVFVLPQHAYRFRTAGMLAQFPYRVAGERQRKVDVLVAPEMVGGYEYMALRNNTKEQYSN